MENHTVKEGKTIAIISYFTIIGTLVAFIMNQKKQNHFASFHIRQALGIALMWFALNLIRGYVDIGWVDNILVLTALILWIFGLIGAIQGEERRIPLLGDQFQEWFRSIR